MFCFVFQIICADFIRSATSETVVSGVEAIDEEGSLVASRKQHKETGVGKIVNAIHSDALIPAIGNINHASNSSNSPRNGQHLKMKSYSNCKVSHSKAGIDESDDEITEESKVV